uniref:C-type lectin domain-containing protein n=1 Tax=Chelonoidis abingdonii TaxID=106734 RepID=A0A8C0J2Z8_CHEAB
MGPGTGTAESKERLQELRVEGNGHLETVGEPEPRRNYRRCNYDKKCTTVLAVALAVVSLGLIITVVLAMLQFMSSSDGRATSAVPSQGPLLVPSLGLPSVPCCLQGWVGYRRKCYYFSEEENNWDSGQHFCSSFNASLAVIDTQEEKDFMMHYAGLVEHWIGLRRDAGQPWKWVNGIILSQQLFEVRAEGNCAYLSDVFVSSSRCYSLRNWICSKPDGHTTEEELVGM